MHGDQVWVVSRVIRLKGIAESILPLQHHSQARKPTGVVHVLGNQSHIWNSVAHCRLRSLNQGCCTPTRPLQSAPNRSRVTRTLPLSMRHQTEGAQRESREEV